MAKSTKPASLKRPSLVKFLVPYRGWILLLVVLTVAASAMGLVVPQVIAKGIDGFTAGRLDLTTIVTELFALTMGTFVVGSLQIVVQTVASERVARDLRARLTDQIALMDYAAVEVQTPAKLLTNLTSDVDAIKTFVSHAVTSLISSVFVIIGASALLLWLNWKLALMVLAIVPLIGVVFFMVLGRVRLLFGQIQGMVDALNKILNESIVGAALVRLLNAKDREYGKFLEVSSKTRVISLQILRQFAVLIPFVGFLSNLATLAILALGGHFVIDKTLTLGEFTAFNSYLTILIFPIIIIGFMSGAIGQAQASYFRLGQVLFAPPPAVRGEKAGALSGAIEIENISLTLGGKAVLKDVSFKIAAGSRTAVIGPTAAGKSQLFYVMIGLLVPTNGTIIYDGRPITDYAKASLYSRMGFVFQDSVLFNLTLRENIAFNATVDEAQLQKAIETAELRDFIEGLPNGLETMVSERGTSLSGGQKQRVMLARALAINPNILFLDDFTARVDAGTEAKILENLAKNYPDLTLISITQKIASVDDYDQIILLMEGEALAAGTHKKLVLTSPEYAQILKSQKSTDHYEEA